MAIRLENIDELLKFRNTKWKTAITKLESNKIITRGYSQEELIGTLSFSEMVYLLINGDKPSKNESKMLEAVLISFCDHGITPPSTQVARLMASTGSPLNSCVSGGIMAFGKYHAGALEQCMKLLQEVVKNGSIINKNHETALKELGSIESPKDIKILAEQIVEKYMQKECKIPGYGHRYHKKDPRAPKLIKLAQKFGFYGTHTQLATSIQEILFQRKNILMNVDGANAGILSDMGFHWKVGTGIFMIGRLPALVAHVSEEKNNESAFRKFLDLDEILFEGTPDQPKN
jgi:citrate synthase